MLISEYLQMRMNVGSALPSAQDQIVRDPIEQGKTGESPFEQELKSRLAASSDTAAVQAKLYSPTTAEQLEVMTGINFSRHAVDRINERNIDVYSDDRLTRLTKGVELAESKGSDDTLVIVDSTAFVVSVKNNKVITAVNAQDLQGNVFTNIDSTVII
ncbi:MAG: TIGR02530 family flagellar biosynthesis protein [Huintestinicola sp.]